NTGVGEVALGEPTFVPQTPQALPHGFDPGLISRPHLAASWLSSRRGSMVTVHLTTDSERGLRGEAQGLAASRRPCETLRGGAGDAESSSALAADPDRARARCAGRDGLGPVGSTSSGGGRASASVPSPVRSLGGFGVKP